MSKKRNGSGIDRYLDACLHDDECEDRAVGALLYYAMFDRSQYSVLETQLKEEMFTDMFLRHLLRGVKRCMLTLGGIDPGKLLDECKPYCPDAAKKLAAILTRYQTEALLGQMSFYVERLQNLTMLRGIQTAMVSTLAAIARGGDVAAVKDALYNGLSFADLSSRGVDVSVTAAEVGEKCWQEWEKLISGECTVLSTGFKKLDEYISGFMPGQLVVVSARTSEGKSALMQQMADSLALQGTQVLYANLEMRDYEVWARHVSRSSGTRLTDLLRGCPDPAVSESIRKANEGFAKSGLRYLHHTSLKASDVCSEARRLKNTSGLDMVVCDYMQLLDPEAYSEAREREVARSCRTLKGLAMELNIPVLVACQLNRKATDRDADGKLVEPSLHHMRESGALEQDADVSLILHRPFENSFSNYRVKVAKNRNGQRSTTGVRLHFDGERMTFREMRDDEPDPMPQVSECPNSDEEPVRRKKGKRDRSKLNIAGPPIGDSDAQTQRELPF